MSRVLPQILFTVFVMAVPIFGWIVISWEYRRRVSLKSLFLLMLVESSLLALTRLLFTVSK